MVPKWMLSGLSPGKMPTVSFKGPRDRWVTRKHPQSSKVRAQEGTGETLYLFKTTVNLDPNLEGLSRVSWEVPVYSW